MLQPRTAKKLRLNAETLSHAAGGTARPVNGSLTGPGCTVLSTCSPECCDTNPDTNLKN
jgi:hypothetical protein